MPPTDHGTPTLPLPKPLPNQPYPPLTLHPRALLSPQTTLAGIYPITIEEGAVVQVRVRVSSYFGAVTIGSHVLLAEKSHIGPLTGPGNEPESFVLRGAPVPEGPGTTLGARVVVETRAVVEAEVVGEGTVVEVGARVGKGARVGRGTNDAGENQFCKICAMCEVQPGEVVPDFTVVWGNGERRTERRGLEGVRMRGVDGMREMVGALMAASGGK